MPEIDIDFDRDRQVKAWDLLENTLETLGDYNRAFAKNKFATLQRLDISVIRDEKETDAYAHLTTEGDSRTEVVVLHNPFATPISPGNQSQDLIAWLLKSKDLSEKPRGLDSNRWGKLITADLAYHALKRAEVTDSAGNYLPVIALSSPSLDRRGFADKQLSKRGENPIRRLGAKVLSVCNYLGYGRLHVGGVSLGAAAANEAVQMADNFDVQGLLLSEMPSFMDRGFIDFSKRYITDEGDLELQGSWIDDGPLVRTELARGGDDYDGSNWFKNGNAMTNVRLVNAMRRNRLFDGLKNVADREIHTTIEYGVASKISQGMEEIINHNEGINVLRGKNLLQVVRATGSAPHAHTENLVYCADVISRSVIFNKSLTIK